MHDVWQLPASKCDFKAPGAKLVGSPSAGSAKVDLSNPGTYYFACSFTGHCDAGQILEVIVASGTSAGNSPTTQPGNGAGGPAAGTSLGECTAPEQVDAATGEVKVSCRSPAVSLAPGDNIFPDILLPNPYPSPTTSPEVILKTVTAEVLDETGRAVPLSEVYLHHIFGDVRFVPAEGAEIRRSPMHQPLPAPYFLKVNTTLVASDESRYANFHVIRTTGVPSDGLKPCIECWCKNVTPPFGSIGCCAKCPTTSTEPPKPYHLQYTVTYTIPKESTTTKSSTDKQATLVVLDIRGGLEYSIQAVPKNTSQTQEGTTNSTIPISTFTRQYPLDFFCPQPRNFSVVKCWGHQHIGARCVTMVDAKTGTEICNSCPEYGTQEGVAGDEAGYLVGMTPTVLDPPYVMQPGQEVILTASYAADQPYAGVMSLMATVLGEFDAREECKIDYAGFIQVRNQYKTNT